MKGFTIIELMIIIGLFGIAAAVAISAVQGIQNGGLSNVSYGFGGMVETRCINGYQYVISDGQARQMMDEYGKGTKCP